MCNTYRFLPLNGQPFEELRQNGISLEFPHGRPNIEPTADIRNSYSAPVVTPPNDGLAVPMKIWA